MNSGEIRNAFFSFFASKGHQIVPSAPMVIKNDPTLMFTNAGMNQFKDIFLGNTIAASPRVANSQKCLRVSGKHNDLEEVGHDTYHHTMFEMLGNWSFGDYFKKEAIGWAYEFLVDVIGLPVDRLYATVFEGSKDDGLGSDEEAYSIWRNYFSENKIIYGSKKDNFWEMGDTGPCGPCSEIHIDLRSAEEINLISGKELVNTGNPMVIEIWNLVFIQYLRKANGELEMLPQKHVDTGMGFERLCMAVQHVQSNYDTDIFRSLIGEISNITGTAYGKSADTDVAMRVVSDHLRAISFSIADGQLPSNNKGGYVIRRILRRAVRYGYTFLGQTNPFIFRMVTALIKAMGDQFPELISQQNLIENVIREEEQAFLKTLETGIRRLNQSVAKLKQEHGNMISGKDAFELYDTYGFPLDLTELILKEQDILVNKLEFQSEMENQKQRSRAAGTLVSDDWVILSEDEPGSFTGYDHLEENIRIIRFRKVTNKGKSTYQLVFDHTPFYAESGGQVGDRGLIRNDSEAILIIDTKKENNLVLHISEVMPSFPEKGYKASVDKSLRNSTANNHTATHLLHLALRKIVGTHVEQKGSLVDPEHLRFDFSHFQKVTDQELLLIEQTVNEMIRENIPLVEHRSVSMEQALKMGAMALFGEKYGESVRVVRYGDSIELCGGTHTRSTGNIGFFRIISESAIAAGIRRIEAITGKQAEDYIYRKFDELGEISKIMKNPRDLKHSIESLVEENNRLAKLVEAAGREKVQALKAELISKIRNINNIQAIIEQVNIDNAASVKDLAFQIRDQIKGIFLVLGAEIEGKAHLTVIISDELIALHQLNAGKIIQDIAKEVNGGGGGQAFYATAGGKLPSGIPAALKKAMSYIS